MIFNQNHDWYIGVVAAKYYCTAICFFIYISSIILQRISCSPDALPVLSVCLFFLYSLLAGHRTDFALNYTCEIPF